MAGVHCEICGGNLVAASRSTMFICDHCGIKYPKNKVRRMFFKDAGVDSNAPVTDEEMERFYHLVEKYFKEENFIDAELVTNRILGANADDPIGNKYFDLLIEMKRDFCVERGILVKYKGKDAMVKVPKLVTAIGNNAFQNNTTIEEVVIPDGVLSLGHDAFHGCSSLKKVTLADSVSFIGYRTFAGCENLTEINLPDGIKFLGDFAFCNCKSLQNVNIPKKMNTINRNAFAFCESLTKLNIGKHITAIGCGAFKGCKNLKTIGSLKEVLFIGTGAFKDCDLMEFDHEPIHRFMDNGLEKYKRENNIK